MDSWPPGSSLGNLLSSRSASDVDAMEGLPQRGGAPGGIPIPHFREIVQRVLWSQKFVKSYNVVLVIGLLVVVARRLVQRRQLAGLILYNTSLQVHHDAPAPDILLGNAPSSTPSATKNKNKYTTQEDDETRPLLEKDLRRRTCIVTAIRIRVRGLLCYQPPPMGYYETPTIGILLVLCLYYGLNLFYVLYSVPFDSSKIFVLADRLGSVFVVNLPILYLLGAKNPFLKTLTGFSYEHVNVLHRAAGRVCIFAAIAHFATFIWVWKTLLAPFLTLNAFLATPVIAFGLVAWCSYILLGITSKEEFRSAFYEVFLFLHVLLQVLALGFLYFHHHNARPYVLISLAIFVADRVLYRIAIKSQWMPGEAAVLSDGETIRLSLIPPKVFSWEAGDHIFLSIPQVSLLHPHPFSISSLPSGWTLGDRLELLIRARNGFSRKLLHHVRDGNIVQAVVDGPYGSPFALECLGRTDVAVGIAGGSGIAVIYPVIHRLAIACGDTKTPKKMIMMWIVREESDLLWLPDGRLDDLRAAGVEILIYVTSVTACRPDMKEHLRTIAEQERLRMGVVVSGPSGMVRDVRNACAMLMRRGDDVDVVTEKFGW